MKTHTFKGGVHPPEMKELSKEKSIEFVIPSSKTVCIPVTQGGAPNTPIVKIGDTVAKGQLIAQSDAFMSAPVHASIAGIVKKIESHLVSGNSEAQCIVIEKSDTEETAYMPVLDPFTCSHEDSIKRVKDAGIVGMGGAAFPTHVKLNPPKEKVIDCVLANAAECEPYLTIDYRTMLENASAVVDGLAIAVKIVNAKAGIIVLEDNKVDLIPILTDAIEEAKLSETISISLCKTKYPQGGEKNLVAATIGREIPAGGLPADAGCVIDNVGTLVAISEAFRQGKPLIERSLTISGGACENPQNIKVPVGTLVGELIPEKITLKNGVAKIISGGPMMGFSMMNANFPVQKNTSGVLFMTTKEISLLEESQCIGCGRCIVACPCGLTPVQMVRSLNASNLTDAKKFGLLDCVECGCCSYACPAKIRLVQRFRAGKAQVRAEMAKAKMKADAKAKGGK